MAEKRAFGPHSFADQNALASAPTVPSRIREASMLRGTRLAIIGLALLASPAAAQSDYPNRTVRIIVPATPGGGADTFARLVAQHLAKELRQQVVVENRPGGGTMTAMEYVASAPPDGHTLYLSPSTTTFMHLVRKSMPWDVRKAFAPVTVLAEVPFALVINPSTKARSVKEFLALAKRESDTMSFGSSGTGTGVQMAMELFLHTAGLKMQHIPYRGVSQAVTDILGNRLCCMMLNVLTAKPYVEAGTLVALGVTSRKRSGAMPDVPTIDEAGLPGFETMQWFGVLATGGTPAPVLNRLQTLIAESMRSPDMQKRLRSEGAEAVLNTPEEFAHLINGEIERWTELGKIINLQRQ
jgi:tripartite-type tricarboxylate transporter receptor subunit TctC